MNGFVRRVLLLAAPMAVACSAGGKDPAASGPEKPGRERPDGDVAPDHAYAAIEKEHLDGVRCRAQVEQILGSEGSVGKSSHFASRREWTLLPRRGTDGSVRFLSPTTLPGLWTVVTRHLNGEPVVERVTARFTSTYTFAVDAKDPAADSCEVAKETQKSVRVFDDSVMANALTDHGILEMVRVNPHGVIYVWSPHMPFSYSSAQEESGANGLRNIHEAVERVARALGEPVALDIGVDPTASASLIRSVVRGEPHLDDGMARPVHALELFFRNMNHHYPAVLVYSNGLISRHIYPGVETPDKYAQVIVGQIEALRARRAEIQAGGAGKGT
jgi:hypothetical protein